MGGPRARPPPSPQQAQHAATIPVLWTATEPSSPCFVVLPVLPFARIACTSTREGPPVTMPPKKKEEAPKERPILGRFRNNLKVRALGRDGPAAVSVQTAEAGGALEAPFVQARTRI